MDLSFLKRQKRRSIVRSGEEGIEIDSKKVFNWRDFPVIKITRYPRCEG